MKFLLVKLAVSAESAPESVKAAFGTMRLIVTVGWAIYPLGYFFSYLGGSADPVMLNVIYNVADVINKLRSLQLSGQQQTKRLLKKLQGSLCELPHSLETEKN